MGGPRTPKWLLVSAVRVFLLEIGLLACEDYANPVVASERQRPRARAGFVFGPGTWLPQGLRTTPPSAWGFPPPRPQGWFRHLLGVCAQGSPLTGVSSNNTVHPTHILCVLPRPRPPPLPCALSLGTRTTVLTKDHPLQVRELHAGRNVSLLCSLLHA